MHTIQLSQSTTTLLLHGPDLSGPYRGARLLPTSAAPHQPTLREEIDLLLEGAPAEIEAALLALGSFLSQARALSGQPGASWGYLEARVTSTASLWRSKIYDGWLQYPGGGAGQRLTGRQGLQLVLLRSPWWEGPEAELPLTNRAAARALGGLTVYNHTDSGPAHDNFVDVAAADIEGDLPTPLRLEFTSANDSGAGRVWVALNQSSDPLNLNLFFEAEQGAPWVTSAAFSNPALSAGQALRLSWNGAAPVELWNTALPVAALARAAGHPFRPLAALSLPVIADPLWFWCELRCGSGLTETVYTGPGFSHDPNIPFVEFPPLFLPPWQVAPGGSPLPLTFVLKCQAANAGSHTLELDWLAFLPLDGWREYTPILSLLPGVALTDDGIQGILTSPTWSQPTHHLQGPGFSLRPGCPARLHFLLNFTASLCNNQTSAVRLFYRPRRSIL